MSLNSEKRQRTAALQDASRGMEATESSEGFGVRQSSAAFKGTGGIQKLSLPVRPQNEEKTAEYLQEVFEQAAVTEIDPIRDLMRISIYLSDNCDSLKLQAVRNHFPGVEITVETLRNEDWAESWKRHFKPFEIGKRLLVKPSWSERKPARGQGVVVLDPGLSFGTGQHPTTRFCLQQIVSFRQPSMSQSFLDIGTGSGILAIAAAKLGYCRVDAFDIDADSISVAKTNARTNHVRINFQQKDLASEPLASNRQYDLICANLLSDLLIQQRARILSRLNPTGRLVLAGILHSEFEEVCGAYQEASLRKVSSRLAGEWESGALQFSAHRSIPARHS